MKEKIALMTKLLNGAVKTEHGFYASTQIEHVTIGISCYPFKKSVSIFTAVTPDFDSKEVRRILFKKIPPPLIHISKSSIELDCQTLDFFLIKYERKTDKIETEDIEAIQVFSSLKKELKEKLVPAEKFKQFIVSADRLSDIQKAPKSLIALEDAALKHKIKFVVSLSENYSYSCVISPEETHLRKKIYSNYTGSRGITFSYPAGGAILIRGSNVYAIRPFYSHETFEDAIKDLYSAGIERKTFPTTKRKVKDTAVEVEK